MELENQQSDGRALRPLSVRSRQRIGRLRRDALAYALVARVARLRRISLRDLLQGSRGSGNAALTRQLAMYLVHVLLGRRQEVIGQLFDRDHTTVSHACAVIEVLREEDAAIDAAIACIEAEGWARPPGTATADDTATEVRHVA